MNDTVIILCFFLYRAELWTDSPDVPCSAQTVKIAQPEGCVQPAFSFQRLILRLLNVYA